MKKFFVIITIFLAITLLASLGVWYVVKKRAASAPSEPAAQEESQPAGKLLVRGVVSAVPSFNGQRVWFLSAGGEILNFELDSGILQKFDLPEKVASPAGVLWQEKGSDFIVEKNQGGHIRYTYVNAAARTLSEYPANMREVVILAGDDRIAYDWVTDEKHELKISNIDGSNFSTVGDLFRPDYVLAANPRKLELVMYAEATSSALVLVDLQTANFKNLAESGRYEQAVFSPDGSKLLVSENRGGILTHWVYDVSSGQKIGDEITNPTFAIWSRDSAGVLFAEDNALKEVSLAAGAMKAWGSFPAVLVRGAFLHPFRDTLFYIDAAGDLYSLELNPSS